jgi:hypothetical protein
VVTLRPSLVRTVSFSTILPAGSPVSLIARVSCERVSRLNVRPLTVTVPRVQRTREILRTRIVSSAVERQRPAEGRLNADAGGIGLGR